MTNSTISIKQLEQEIALREAALRLKEGLPHIYGQKMYRWQRQFYESRTRYTTLVASNQSGKSAIQWRKAIRWATDKDLWPKLWNKTPTQFWYLYPDGGTATSEFENKVKVEFLPKEHLKDHPIYGWKAKYKNGDIDYVRFATGVTIYFKSYSQNVHNLQAGSAFAIFCDEEPDFSIIPELQMRTAATSGYMSFVFTATKGQEEWRRIVEERGQLEMWKETEVDITKIQVSAYDCLYYEDGSPSEIWTIEKIEEAKRFLHTEAQIQRRIMGRFVKDEGLKYSSFSRSHVVIPHASIDFTQGQVFAGLDYGSGTNHQSSISLVWTNKDHTYGALFDIWIGDKGIPTTAGDVILKYKEMLRKHGLKHTQVQAFYDWSAADMKTIAQSSGLYLEKADKNHATGERILNTIFKNGMFKIMEAGSYEMLCKQFETLTIDETKRFADDDGADSCRYSVTKIPWVYTDLRDKPPALPTKQRPISRHEPVTRKNDEPTYEDEINEWAEYFEFTDYDNF
jgi:phage terminase large subunit-like protein